MRCKYQVMSIARRNTRQAKGVHNFAKVAPSYKLTHVNASTHTDVRLLKQRFSFAVWFRAPRLAAIPNARHSRPSIATQFQRSKLHKKCRYFYPFPPGNVHCQAITSHCRYLLQTQRKPTLSGPPVWPTAHEPWTSSFERPLHAARENCGPFAATHDL